MWAMCFTAVGYWKSRQIYARVSYSSGMGTRLMLLSFSVRGAFDRERGAAADLGKYF